jgi:hypothetical protein
MFILFFVYLFIYLFVTLKDLFDRPDYIASNEKEDQLVM